MITSANKKLAAFLACILMLSISLADPANSADAGSKAYKIGLSDVLSIKVYAGGELQHESESTVSAGGMVSAPLIGAVKALGLTTGQLEEAIQTPLAEDYLVNPSVNVSIKEYHSLNYYISGAVKEPGLVEMASNPSLLEVIAKAGGVLPEAGNLALITKSGGKGADGSKKTIQVNLEKLLDQGDMSENPILHPGDVVYIPLKQALNLSRSKIYVEGEVANPGVYDYQPGMTAMNACIMAGGFGLHAAPNRTRIIRKQSEKEVKIIKINLNRVQAGSIPDVELTPGDRIHVPESWL